MNLRRIWEQLDVTQKISVASLLFLLLTLPLAVFVALRSAYVFPRAQTIFTGESVSEEVLLEEPVYWEDECPDVVPPHPEFCLDGTIAPRETEGGCYVGYICIKASPTPIPAAPAETEVTEGEM